MRHPAALVLLAVALAYQGAPLAAAFTTPARHAAAGHHAERAPASPPGAHHHAGCPWDRAGHPCPHDADGGGPSLAACAVSALAQPAKVVVGGIIHIE